MIEAETIQRRPGATMRALWSTLGLEIRPDALRWSEDSVPEDWQQVAGWHQGVSASTGIRPPDDDDTADAAVAEAAATEPRLRTLLAHHLPFYRKLKAWALPAGDARPDGDAWASA